MLFKLSMSGLKSKLQDYIVLLLGLIISISTFYMFQTLAINKAFLESNSTISSMGFIFQIGSVLLAIITFFYSLYANSFLLSLRQKEFGMYMMLGAKKHKITLLMFLETIIVGAASLVIGIIIGVGLAAGIGQLLMKQLAVTIVGYQPFYIPSIIVTCIFFFGLFVLSASMNSMKLARLSVLQLVHADAQTERVAVKGNISIIVAILGMILLGIGYASMFYISKLQQLGFAIGLLAPTVGTYCLFGSLLPVMIKKLKNNKERSEKGLNAFTFAQLNFRMNSLANVLATVAILVALGAGGIAVGMAFKNEVPLMVDQMKIYDSVIHNPTAEEQKILDGIPFKEKDKYRYKIDDKYIYYVKEDLEKQRPLVKNHDNIQTAANLGKRKRVSDALPIGTFSRSKYTYETDANKKELPKQWNEVFKTIQPIYMYPNHEIKIVDQNMYNNMKSKEHTVFIGYTDDFQSYFKKWEKLDELQAIKYNKVKHEKLDSKYQWYNRIYGENSGIMFMGFFVGIAFLAMMASCLMFKVLSGASTDITRYQMLRKIGVRQDLLTKSIYKELFFVFVFPAVVGIMHILFGMKMFGVLLIDPYLRIWLPIVIFLVIYCIYYLITVQLYKRIVLPKEG
ncbi:ABC transporter permease [Bacillus wiedmannii]|uniref:ABC transporter permease n=1 Tax=Bacillus wiedmannii TaxID=1890302 RepID=UPI000BF0DCF3|nr:ABC transporter permease [Bacillus wiedmannii]PEJ68087.1 ABC transporter permease [Bacillus wiedmannii]